MAIPLKHFTFVRAELLTECPTHGQVEVIADSWWTMRGEEIAFYRGSSPQCNSNKVISDRVSKIYSWCTEVRFIPRVYLPFHDVEVSRGGEYYGPERRYQFTKVTR